MVGNGISEPSTLKTNMSLENQWLEDVFPTEIAHFYGGHVSFQGCMCYALKSSQEMYEMQEIPGEDDAVRGVEGQQKIIGVP